MEYRIAAIILGELASGLSWANVVNGHPDVSEQDIADLLDQAANDYLSKLVLCPICNRSGNPCDTCNQFGYVEPEIAFKIKREVDQAEWDAICAEQGHEWYLASTNGEQWERYCRQCGKREARPKSKV